MKVAIVFHNFGGGHKEAALNVKAALERIAPAADVRLFDGLALAPRALGGLFGAFWERVQSKSQWMWAFMYSFPLFASRFSRYWAEWWIWWDLRAALTDFAPDHVLSTHHFCPLLAERLRRQKRLDYTITHCHTEFVWHQGFDWHPFLTRYLVPTDELQRRVAELGFPAENIRKTGIPIKAAFEHRVQKSEARATLGIETEKRVVFLFAGTLGGVELAPILRGLKSRDVFPVVVCGRSVEARARVDRLFTAESIEGKVYGFVDFMPTILSACDFMIGKGGALSVSECLALSVPTILHGSPPGNETGNAEFMQEVGAGIIADSVADVLTTVDELLAEPARLVAMADAATAHRMPQAALAAAEVILDLERARFAA